MQDPVLCMQVHLSQHMNHAAEGNNFANSKKQTSRTMHKLAFSVLNA